MTTIEYYQDDLDLMSTKEIRRILDLHSISYLEFLEDYPEQQINMPELLGWLGY